MKKSLLTGFVTILTALLIGGCGSTQNITGNAENVAPSNAVMENVTSVSYSYPGNSSKDFQMITGEGENTASAIISKLDPDKGKRLISIDGGNTWITEGEYEENYPDYPKIDSGDSSDFPFIANAHDDGSGYGFLFDSNVLTKIDANSGNVLVSIDNGNTWLTIKDYEEQYPDYPDIAYSNAEEFQEWINEQVEKAQNRYWENNGGKGWNW